MSGTVNPITVTMNSNKSVTATFALNPPNTFTLTVNYAGNGSGQCDAQSAGPDVHRRDDRHSHGHTVDHVHLHAAGAAMS